MKYNKRNKKINLNISNITPSLVYDDREKKRWKSSFYRTTKKRLKIGDYTFEGFEDIIRIERKYSLKELFQNLSGKSRKDFYVKIDKLSNFPVRCFIVEDLIENITKTIEGLKKKNPNIKMSNETIWCCLNRIMFYYKVPVLFVGKTFRTNKREFDCFLSYMLEQARNI